MKNLRIQKVTPAGYHYLAKSKSRRVRFVHARVIPVDGSDSASTDGEQRTLCHKIVHRSHYNRWVNVPDDEEITCSICSKKLAEMQDLEKASETAQNA